MPLGATHVAVLLLCCAAAADAQLTSRKQNKALLKTQQEAALAAGVYTKIGALLDTLDFNVAEMGKEDAAAYHAPKTRDEFSSFIAEGGVELEAETCVCRPLPPPVESSVHSTATAPLRPLRCSPALLPAS